MMEQPKKGFSAEKKWAVVCYIPIFNIVPAVLASVKMVNSNFCLFHARQGLVLFVVWLLTILVAFISKTLSLMLWGVVLLLHGVGFYIAFQGSMAKIPIISDLALKIPPHYLYKRLTGKEPEFGDSEKDLDTQGNDDILDRQSDSKSDADENKSQE